MAEAVKKVIKLLSMQGLLVLLAQTSAGFAYGEQLPDPTRPADQQGQVQSGTAPTGPVLQSVLISPERKVAIISGKAVRVGEKFGESRVVSITETEVVMRNGKDQKTLRLFPDVQKRLTSSGINTKTDHQRQ